MDTEARWVDAGDKPVGTDKLVDDLRGLARDMERLLEATAGDTSERVVDVRSKAGESLHAARVRLAHLQDATVARARAAGREADRYVHANPWQLMAACAATGIVLGILLTRNEPVKEDR